MADGIYPSQNDRKFDLWKKIAWNLYNYANEHGISGLNTPSQNDRLFDLQKKVAYYTAILADS